MTTEQLRSGILAQVNTLLEDKKVVAYSRFQAYDIPLSQIEEWTNRPRISTWELPRKQFILAIKNASRRRALKRLVLNMTAGDTGDQLWENSIEIEDSVKMVLSTKESYKEEVQYPSSALMQFWMKVSGRGMPEGVRWNYSIDLFNYPLRLGAQEIYQGRVLQSSPRYLYQEEYSFFANLLQGNLKESD